MPLHFRTWKQAVEEQGCSFPLEMFYALGGVPLPRTVELLNERFGYSMHPQETAKRKEDLYLDVVAQVHAVPAVLKHIEAAHGRIPFAIVSGSPRASILATLERLGLSGHFQLVVGAEDYTRGKPDPEPFLVAAQRLGVRPESCLVFEDADAGIAAAEAAGMRWVRVPWPEIVDEEQGSSESATFPKPIGQAEGTH